MEQQEEFRSIATKVSPATFEAINRICRKLDITVYEMLQIVIDTIVRYKDDQHNLSQEMEEAMSIFEHMTGWKDSCNLANYSQEYEFGEATYFMQCHGKKGARAVHIEKPFMGTPNETFNIQIILERTINLLLPELYKRLRVVGIDLGTTSILQTLQQLVGEHIKEQDLIELRNTFEDANRSEFGKKPADAPYRRKMHYGMESIDRQSTIDFDDAQ